MKADSGSRFPAWSWAVVALGSNLGDSTQIVRSAMDRLGRYSSFPVIRSSLWRSVAVECPPGSGDFINAMVGLIPLPGETPESLLEGLQALEREFGRRPKRVMNEPRPLDLDLIAFGRETRDTPGLTLPHPRAHQRRFVLEPLCEIAPDLMLPGCGESVRELLARLPADPPAVRLA